jgi:hypothetical protein
MVNLYVISDGEYLKVGISSTPRKRLKQMQTSNARELKLVKEYPIGNRKTTEAWELYVHKRLAEYHVRGEWFKAPLQRTKKFLNALLIDRQEIYPPS